MIKAISSYVVVSLVSAAALAQEHGHSHGAAGELEHSMPMIIILGLLVIVGAAFYLINKKK